MTTLVKHGEVCADPYTTLGPDAPIPSDGDLIVSLERWRADRAQLTQRSGRLGIRLKSDEPPGLLADELEAFALVALEFPAFRDGRAYSYARLLRDQYGFAGEIRAVGDVLVEQLQFMLRVGFDAFELKGEDPEREFRAVANEISISYQPAHDDRATALELRLRGA